MKKSLNSFSLLALILLLMFTLSLAVLAADSGSCGENVTYTLNGETGTLTISGSGEMTDYLMNKAPWSSNFRSIKNVVIESGVTSIGNCAFSGCSMAQSITIPDSVTSIGYYAFWGCTNLESVLFRKV